MKTRKLVYYEDDGDYVIECLKCGYTFETGGSIFLYDPDQFSCQCDSEVEYQRTVITRYEKSSV